MAKPPTSARDPFIPINEDDEDAPTVARNLGPAAAASVAPGPAAAATRLDPAVLDGDVRQEAIVDPAASAA